MDKLTFHLHNFDSLERHQFKLYVKSSVSKKESKLREVLELFYKGYTSKSICETVYGSYPNAGYYALRKRLMVLLLEYFAYEKGKELNAKENEIRLHFDAGKNLVLHKSYKLGFYHLTKALEKSKQNDFYTLTHEIVLELIQVAHLSKSLNVKKLIEVHKNYRELRVKQDTIAYAYAEVKETLNTYFLNSQETSALKEIESIFKKYQLNLQEDLNYRTLYQLSQLLLATSTVTKNFVKELESLEAIAQRIIVAREPKNFNQWIFKFKLLYLFASSNYRAKKFKKSNEYLIRILKLSKTKSVALSHELHFKIVVLKSLNINYLDDNSQAFEVLNDLLKTSKLPKSNKNWLDGFGVMSMILFHGKKYSSVVKLYHDLKKSDSELIKIIGLEWVLRKNLILILTHFELGNIEICEELITRFEVDNQRFLSEHQRVLFFIICIQKVVSNPFQAQNSHFHRFVESKLEKKPRYEEDIFVLSFFAWLKAKMLGEEVYESTIGIVENLGNEI